VTTVAKIANNCTAVFSMLQMGSVVRTLLFSDEKSAVNFTKHGSSAHPSDKLDYLSTPFDFMKG